MQKRANTMCDNLLSVQYDSFGEQFGKQADKLVYDYTVVPVGPIDGLHHHDAIEVGFCLSGTGVFWVDGEMLPFSAPCVSVLYPGQLHKAKATNDEGSRWVFVTFRGESIFPYASGGFGQLPMAGAHPQNALISGGNIVTLAAVMEEEIRTGAENRAHCIRGLLAAILIQHSRMPRKQAVQGAEQRNALVRLAHLLHYIDQNYAQKLDSASLAKRAHVHPATLREWFHSALGVSPLQYIHRVRITAACSLLRGTEYSVSQIASMVGYASLSAFNRHFREVNNCCPMEYRRGSHTGIS